MCIVVPNKTKAVSGHSEAARGMRKKMVVLPMLARRAGTRYRESEGGRKRAGDVGKRGDIVGGGGGGSWWEHRMS